MTDPINKQKPPGYANPPSDKQFKKGISGNPKGRPRGSINPFSDNLQRNAVARLVNKKITAIRNGQRVEISVLEALDASLVKKSAISATAAEMMFKRQELAEKRRVAQEKNVEAINSKFKRVGMIIPVGPSTIEGWQLLYKITVADRQDTLRQEWERLHPAGASNKGNQSG